jgi:hypothetical protein
MTKACQRIPRLLRDHPSVVLGREAFDGSDDEAAGRVRLDLAPPHYVELDAVSREAAQVLERAGQIPGKAVQVVHDHEAGAGRLDSAG